MNRINPFKTKESYQKWRHRNCELCKKEKGKKLKKLFFICIFIIYTVSCGMTPNWGNENYFEWDSLKELEDIINEKIEYKSDEEIHNIKDYWQTPEETMKLLSGDCEDKAILFLSEVYKKTKEKGEKLIQERENYYHASAYLKDENFYFNSWEN